MNADRTFLVDKHAPGFSSKLERLQELWEELAAEDDRKIVLFSEWTTMLTLIERQITRLKLDSVRLDGSIPQRKRQQPVQLVAARSGPSRVPHHERGLDGA